MPCGQSCNLASGERRLREVAGLRLTVRWWVAGLVTVVAFSMSTWASGVLLLPLVLKSDADRWVVAAALGVAVAALAGLWGQSWATNEAKGGPGTTAAGERSITVAGDISGIASTGDNATNTQQG
jgi:hypothetical protein